MNQQQLHKELSELLDRVHEDPQSAQMVAEKAILWASRNGWLNILAMANLVAGWANLNQHLHDTAVEHFQRANTLFKDVAEPEMVAQGYHGLGSVYLKIGEYSQAIEHLRKAISWLNRLEEEQALAMTVRLRLARALMNIGYWSDAEQELLSTGLTAEMDDVELAEYQLLVLRLAFYRGDQRSIKEQIQLCREIVLGLDLKPAILALNYYSSRYVAKFEKLKVGEAELQQLWLNTDKSDVNVFYLAYEAALDLLHSDYPQRGIHWLSLLLDEDNIPLSLQQQIHFSLAHFFVAHLSHELATEHYQAAEQIASAIRESEVSQQWARYRADEAHQTLRKQIDQHKKNNQILAESNALLQAVNRIAMTVNSALDIDSLLRRLRDQLAGWIDCEVIAIASLRDEALYFNCIFEGERRISGDVIPLTETRAWSVRAVDEGRILYDNDFVRKDELLMADSPNMVRSVSFTPLKCENRVIGILSLQSRRANVFDLRAISLLEYIAPVVGIAFANLLNLQRTRELSGELNKQTQELNDVRQLMAHMSDHDEQTGLPNRSSLPLHLEQWRRNGGFSCLVLRVTNLDEVNNQVGFGSDEEIIKVIAQRLRNRVRPDDLLVRLGSDQFLLFVEQMASKDMVIEFANQLLQLAEQPLRAKDHTVGANVAIGIVKFPDHGETLEEIMSMVSIALSHAASDESSIFCVE